MPQIPNNRKRATYESGMMLHLDDLIRIQVKRSGGAVAKIRPRLRRHRGIIWRP
jgi:hypothetical protein